MSIMNLLNKPKWITTAHRTVVPHSGVVAEDPWRAIFEMELIIVCQELPLLAVTGSSGNPEIRLRVSRQTWAASYKQTSKLFGMYT